MTYTLNDTMMDITKQVILDAIEEVYKKRYVGTLKITKLKPMGYNIRLGMNNDDKPINISAQLEGENFLKFFKQELRDRGWNTIHWFLGYKVYPDNGSPIDSNCNCKK